MTRSVLEVCWGGQSLQLLAGLAAYVPVHQTLLVADVHIGKAQSFRRLGVPVPGGTTVHTLNRLSRLVVQTAARELVFLGDLLHAKNGLTAATDASVQAWRREHAALKLTLVRGNHDRHAGDPPPAWQIGCVTEPYGLVSRSAADIDDTDDSSLQNAAPGLALCHHPRPLAGRFVLAGHVHPAAVLRGRGPGRLRLPCFHFSAQVGVLPAFGPFTGMHQMPRAVSDRVYVVAGDDVHELPARP